MKHNSSRFFIVFALLMVFLVTGVFPTQGQGEYKQFLPMVSASPPTDMLISGDIAFQLTPPDFFLIMDLKGHLVYMTYNQLDTIRLITEAALFLDGIWTAWEQAGSFTCEQWVYRPLSVNELVFYRVTGTGECMEYVRFVR